MADRELGRFRDAFARLRSDKSASRWPAETRHRAPHKPLLLLTIMDLVAQEYLRDAFVPLDDRLLEEFDHYWASVLPGGRTSDLALPYFHLKSDGFWSLVPRPGMEQVVAAVDQIRSLGPLRASVLGARLDPNLFHLLVQRDTRNALRQVLIETYFAPDLWPTLLDVAQIAMQSAAYETRLRGLVRQPFALQEAIATGLEYRVEARSTAFRRTVVTAYNATCAMCGVRLKTPEGRAAVAAAHIVPWSVSHNDDPRNGVALCGLHHWTFDQGLAAITIDLRVRVSTVIGDVEGTQPLRVLSGRGIHHPTEAKFQPAPDALAWHLEHVFRR